MFRYVIGLKFYVSFYLFLTSNIKKALKLKIYNLKILAFLLMFLNCLLKDNCYSLKKKLLASSRLHCFKIATILTL